jgi:hypothetical protein
METRIQIDAGYIETGSHGASNDQGAAIEFRADAEVTEP